MADDINDRYHTAYGDSRLRHQLGLPPLEEVPRMGLMDKTMDRAMAKLEDRFGDLRGLLQQIIDRLDQLNATMAQINGKLGPGADR